MIIETFKKKPIVRIHTLHKSEEINRITSNVDFEFKIGPSNLNPLDQFNSALEINYKLLNEKGGKKLDKLIATVADFSYLKER